MLTILPRVLRHRNVAHLPPLTYQCSSALCHAECAHLPLVVSRWVGVSRERGRDRSCHSPRCYRVAVTGWRVRLAWCRWLVGRCLFLR